jgi:alpha-D-xyloside xylohydrolase
MDDQDWALLPPPPSAAKVLIDGHGASIRNGRIEARVTDDGMIEFRKQNGEQLLREYVRRRDTLDPPRSALKIPAREFRPIAGGDYGLCVRFEAQAAERIFGMGQYQHEFLDLKGCTLELAHRNSQASVPFALSSLGYGLLWNNPAIGQVTFARNVTEWRAHSTRQLDYWVTAGDTPAEVVEAYTAVTGRVPLMPDWGTGLWQSKLRYRTQDELLAVAREYLRRGLPLSVIAADFFHWPTQGDWRFDVSSWPDAAAMVAELRASGVELMVSVWPTVARRAERFAEMLRRGYLIRTERGTRTTGEFVGNTVYVDVTNPDARRYLWEAIRSGYWDAADVRVFWLDEAEPEFVAYEFDHYRFFLGSDLQVGNVFPTLYAKAFHDGLVEAGEQRPMVLIRSAWAGSQRYGALVWSGDIDATFESFRCQVRAGLNMGLAGIPWWTSDIGGFHGGSAEDPAFRELLTRWFQFATFCPVLRMHGEREPHVAPLVSADGAVVGSGAPNEVWSYGTETYEILARYLRIRERLRPYIAGLMRDAHERGTPPIRPLFYDFPSDPLAWDVDDAFLFGPDLLVAPVLHAGDRWRRVYLPAGTTWRDTWTGAVVDGGSWVDAAAPIEDIPLFQRGDVGLPILEDA